MKARIVDGKIAEILVPVANFSIEECFHSSVLAQCADVSEDAQVGDDYVAPVASVAEETTEEPVAEETPTEPTV
jgi:hypothetical protein